MHGRVLKGLFKNRDIASMSAADLALLWQDCRHTDKRSAQLIEARIRECDFRGAVLTGAGLHHSNVFDTSFGDANLERVVLYHARMQLCRFVGAIATDANFGSAHLESCDFRGAALSGSKFYRTDLTRSCLGRTLMAGCDLREAKLGGVDFTGATLTNALLDGAVLFAADLRGADLRGARGMTGLQLSQAAPIPTRFFPTEREVHT